jgi:hypothetical protein
MKTTLDTLSESEQAIDVTVDRMLLKVRAEDAIDRKRVAGCLALLSAIEATEPDDICERGERFDGGTL